MDNYYHALTQLTHRLQAQAQCIQVLEQKIKELQSEIESLKEKPYTKIDNIEYKFDQLKVEKLNGTLNIGLNPFSSEAVEDFSVTGDKIQMNGSPINKQNPMPHLEEQERLLQMQQKAEKYLYSQGKKVIKQIAKGLDIKVSEEVMNYILDDIRRQLPARIHFQQGVILQNQKKTLSSEDLDREVLQALEKDIRQAVEIFLLHLPKQMGDEKT